MRSIHRFEQMLGHKPSQFSPKSPLLLGDSEQLESVIDEIYSEVLDQLETELCSFVSEAGIKQLKDKLEKKKPTYTDPANLSKTFREFANRLDRYSKSVPAWIGSAVHKDVVAEGQVGCAPEHCVLKSLAPTCFCGVLATMVGVTAAGANLTTLLLMWSVGAIDGLGVLGFVSCVEGASSKAEVIAESVPRALAPDFGGYRSGDTIRSTEKIEFLDGQKRKIDLNPNIMGRLLARLLDSDKVIDHLPMAFITPKFGFFPESLDSWSERHPDFCKKDLEEVLSTFLGDQSAAAEFSELWTDEYLKDQFATFKSNVRDAFRDGLPQGIPESGIDRIMDQVESLFSEDILTNRVSLAFEIGKLAKKHQAGRKVTTDKIDSVVVFDDAAEDVKVKVQLEAVLRFIVQLTESTLEVPKLIVDVGQR